LHVHAYVVSRDIYARVVMQKLLIWLFLHYAFYKHSCLIEKPRYLHKIYKSTSEDILIIMS